MNDLMKRWHLEDVIETQKGSLRKERWVTFALYGIITLSLFASIFTWYRNDWKQGVLMTFLFFSHILLITSHLRNITRYKKTKAEAQAELENLLRYS